jgi:hypothetical protein
MEAMLGAPCIAILISIIKNALSFLLLFILSLSTKLEIRAEEVLPGSKWVGGEKERVRIGEKWLKHCMHI